MNPIDKLNELDYTEAFCDKDADHFEPGIFCIFSDNGHIWHIGTLTGIEDTIDGKLYRNENNLQYKHCRYLHTCNAHKYLQQVIVKEKPVSYCYDGFIIGEYKDCWRITTCQGASLVEKSKVAFIDNIKFGGEE